MYDDEYAIDPPTENRTTLSPKGVDGLSTDEMRKYRELNMQNSGLYTGTHMDKEVDRQLDYRRQFHVVAGHFDLTKSQRQRSEYLFVEMPDHLRKSMSVLVRATVCCHYIRCQYRVPPDDQMDLLMDVIETIDLDLDTIISAIDLACDHLTGEQWTHE